MAPRGLALDIADIVLGERFSEPADRAQPEPVGQLGTLAGVYRDPATGDLLRIQSDATGLSLGFDDPQRLVRYDDGTFRNDEQPLMRLRFEEHDGRTLLFSGARYSPTPEQVLERVNTSDDASRAWEGGEFYGAEVGTAYCLEPVESGLIMKHYRLDDRRLYHAFGDTYAANNLRIELERNAAGDVTGYRASTFRVRNVRFERR
jgi:hypothetical protein